MSQARFSPKTVRFYIALLAMIAILGITTAQAAWAQGDTAFGTNALINDTSGDFNSAFGFDALEFNTTGYYNTASGASALINNTIGAGNTASGLNTLFSNTSGSSNTANGATAMYHNTTGINNTVTGASALLFNTTGSDNTASGETALYANTTGSSNIAIGDFAGGNLTTGNNNIDIGNNGVKGESSKIRIGATGTQTATYIAGISTDSLTSGTPVVVNSSGRLGVLSSSARYKRDIRDMGDASGKLMKLRPVTFRYKADPSDTRQYGLIAEEVEKVYPELVIRGADGKPETVAYHMLPAMLLNELQTQARAAQQRDREQNRLASRVEQQTRQLVQKDAENLALQREVASLKQKVAKIDALAKANAAFAVRLDALEQNARASRPERMAAAMR